MEGDQSTGTFIQELPARQEHKSGHIFTNILIITDSIIFWRSFYKAESVIV